MPNESLLRTLHSWIRAAAALLIAWVSTHSGKADFALNVKDSSSKPVSNFRWILEEDNNGITTPGLSRMDSTSLKMHKSHAPLMSGPLFGSRGRGRGDVPLPEETPCASGDGS